MNYEEFLLTKASFVNDVISILLIKQKYGLSLTNDEKQLSRHIRRFKAEKLAKTTESLMSCNTIIKSCENCAYRKGKFGYAGLCMLTGSSCTMQRHLMNSRCDQNFSGWVERPKPWILRFLGL